MKKRLFKIYWLKGGTSGQIIGSTEISVETAEEAGKVARKGFIVGVIHYRVYYVMGSAEFISESGEVEKIREYAL